MLSLLFFGLMPVGWLHTGMMPSMYESMIQNKNERLCAYSKLHQSPCADCLVQTTDKKIQTWCDFFIALLTVCLCSVYRHCDDIPSQTRLTWLNNCSNNHNGGNMYDLWLIKWLSSKACESEFNHLWWQYGKSAICDKHRNCKLGKNKKQTMTNDNI